MIDTHVHLTDSRLAPRTEEIVRGFDAAGLDAVVDIGADMESSFAAAENSERYATVFCALGVHPEGVRRTTEADYEALEQLILRTPKCIAVGEIGLDYHYPEPSREEQIEAFVRQLELAKRLGKHVVIHVREAYGDTIEILRNYYKDLPGGIIHCYSGSVESAKIFTDMGFSIAFGGAITFKNNTHAGDVIRSIPKDRLLLETDCPYLTPVPFRGKCDNEPKLVVHVRDKMAEYLGITPQEVDRITTENFYRTFGLREDKFCYEFGGALYVNLTNRCSNACDFCLRRLGTGIGDNDLWLCSKASAGKVQRALERAGVCGYGEVVFCGYGEPTYELEILKEVCAYLHARGIRTRLNTNGQGSLINGRDIVPELVGLVDSVSVSLNAPSAREYQDLCHSEFGEEAFGAMLDFAKRCSEAGIATALSVVDVIGAEKIAECKALCQKIGVPCKVRAYISTPQDEQATRLL